MLCWIAIRILALFLLSSAQTFPAQYPHGRVTTPNTGSLPWQLDGEVKVFRLVAEPIKREFAPGLVVNLWGYNGTSPGPTIEAVEGDRVRIIVTNRLPEGTTVHWHGLILPNGMDGVPGLNQPLIKPGETAVYEFTLHQSGTFMYHSHADELVQLGMGLMGFFIIHPKEPESPPVDRDFALMLMEWAIPLGGSTPDPLVMLEFNYFTFNSVLYPAIEPLVAKQGERIRIRLANLSMNNHPIHIHGHEFEVVRRGAGLIQPSARYTEVTTDVPVGATRDIEFVAGNPGDWAVHCHKTHHTMNGMAHGIPNLLGIETKGIEDNLGKIFPETMFMGASGMEEMFEMSHHMKRPPNTLPLGNPGPHGIIELGGMFTILKIRPELEKSDNPGWYKQPEGTSVKIELAQP